MGKIEVKLRTLKYLDPRFNNDNSNVEKQCFFLNLLNFLVLYSLSEQMISNQESVMKLNSYNMWQAFLS